jgi:hypothetical protein
MLCDGVMEPGEPHLKLCLDIVLLIICSCGHYPLELGHARPTIAVGRCYGHTFVLLHFSMRSAEGS